jgi:hypothetical protein
MRRSWLPLLFVVLVAGCGGAARPQTSLTMVALNTTVGRAEFHLRCRPGGGDLPRAKQACAVLAADPRLLTRPQPFTCAGGSFSWWDVTVAGRLNGKPIHRSFSTCWTPQMNLIGRLGLSWDVLKAHLVTRRVKTVPAGQLVAFRPGVLRPTDLVACTIRGHKLDVGVPEQPNIPSSNGYGGANINDVELEVARLPDGGVTATCHDGMTPSPETFTALALESPAGKAWGLGELFSRTTGTRRCVLHGGGPPPGIRVPGMCSSVVLLGDGVSATVRFTETWDAGLFHGPGAGNRPRLSHVYELVVSTHAVGGDHIVRSKDYGDVPPQLVP